MVVEGSSEEKVVPTHMEVPVERNIEQWMETFKTLYETPDLKRSPLEMWVAATSHFAGIGESIRRMDFKELMKEAAHAFCWMCSFVLACQRDKDSVFALKESFSSIVASKYPLVCKHCRETFCHCNPQSMDAASNKGANYRKLLEQRKMLANAPDTYGLSQWLKTFNDIYGQNTHMLTLESIGFHFLEEAGEELTALRGLVQLKKVKDESLAGIDTAFLEKLATYEGIVELYEIHGTVKPETKKREPIAIMSRLVHAKMDMVTEFADTFSWFCSILNKTKSIAANCGENCQFAQDAFQDTLNRVYLRNGSPCCPSCDNSPCGCVFYN